MKKQRSLLRQVLIGVGILAALAAVLWVFLFEINRFALSVKVSGEPDVILEYGEPYEDPGASVRLTGTLLFDDGFTPQNAKILIDGTVDSTVLGDHTVVYRAEFLWFQGQARRTIHVVDTQPPVITLTEDTVDMTVEGAVYQEPGYSAWDNCDGDLTDQVLLTHSQGKVTYVAIDSSGNMTYVDREVPYYDPVAPIIRLEGGETFFLPAGTQYEEPGYSARDNVDGDLTEQVEISGTVDRLRPGTYPITYTVCDASGNASTVVRHVEVTAAERPRVQWPDSKTIYLTFDDGPGPETPRLLDILDEYGIQATFFVVDSEYRYLLKEITDRGHSIGIHSVTHDYALVYESPEAYFQDLYAMQQIILKETGVKTNLMRFPGGSSNEVSIRHCEGIMTFLTEAVQDAGFRYFDWNVDSDDAGDTHSTKGVRKNVIDGILETGVSLVLQHDVYDYSVDAVEDIILWGLNNGYTFLPLSADSPGFPHPLNN